MANLHKCQCDECVECSIDEEDYPVVKRDGLSIQQVAEWLTGHLTNCTRRLQTGKQASCIVKRHQYCVYWGLWKET